MSAFDPKTDRIINRAVIILSIGFALVLGATAVAVAWPRLTHAFGRAPATPAPAYRTGQTIDVPADWYQASPHTLVLFARSSCSACQEAQPFLKGLVAGLGGHAAVVLASTGQEREEELRYGRAIGIEDALNKIAPAGLKVQATPTLVLINQRGEILGAWEGVGPPDRQTIIANAVKAAIGD
jgi:thioredoxin-related protein